MAVSVDHIRISEEVYHRPYAHLASSKHPTYIAVPESVFGTMCISWLVCVPMMVASMDTNPEYRTALPGQYSKEQQYSFDNNVDFITCM
jgi:hypothetical protein